MQMCEYTWTVNTFIFQKHLNESLVADTFVCQARDKKRENWQSVEA